MTYTYLNRTKAILIDLDGTMVDSAPDIVEAGCRLLREFGAAELPADVITGFIGNGVPTLVSRLLAASPAIAGTDQERAIAVFYRHYAATNGCYSRLFPGVADGLPALQEAGFQLACVTNKPMVYTEALLQAFDLRQYLSVVIGGDTLARMKPDPLPLLHACQMLGVSPRHAVMVGDSHVDVAASRAAGLPVYIMRYGYSGPAGAAGLHADRVLDSLAELPGLLATAG
ncbi:MAG: phosphoglycolate phosphatase [Burkholderiaceae bacterium]